MAVVVVEIPALETFFEDASAAPQPTARQTFNETLGGFARQQGAPFWVTSDYLEIPYSYFADGVHIHMAGALIYSEWLGSQLGAAVRLGLLDGALPEAYLSTPPLSDYVPEREFLSSYALSEQEAGQFAERRAAFGLTPTGSRVFSPNSTALELDYELAIIGFYIHWSETINDSNRDPYYDLMILRERLIYPEDLDSQETLHLADWHIEHNPAHLAAMDVDYLFFTEQWDDPASAPDSTLNDPNLYELIWALDFPPLHESYTLYQVK